MAKNQRNSGVFHGKIAALSTALAAGLALPASLSATAPSAIPGPPKRAAAPVAKAAPKANPAPAAASAPQQETGPIEIEPAGLKGIIPGVSTVAQVKTTWGEPKDTKSSGKITRYVYEIQGFKTVEVFTQDDRVTYIIVTFSQPFPPDVVAKQLRFTGIEPVVIYDDAGAALGQAFPERGVLFSFDASSKTTAVSQLLLEGVTAEHFIVRAEARAAARPQAALDDLAEGIRRDAANHRAHYVKAQILADCRQSAPALAAIDEALAHAADDVSYRLLRARILADVGRATDATDAIAKLVEGKKLAPHQLARAKCLQGDIASRGPSRDAKQALTYHMAAIEAAEPAVTDKNTTARRQAKRVLVDAYLGAAHDIAFGQWNKKESVVPKWLAKAGEAADDLVKNEGAGDDLRFEIARRTVTIAAASQGKVDSGRAVADMNVIGNQIISTSGDPLLKSRTSWQLAQGLAHAMQHAHARGQGGVAVQYGQAAIRHLANVEPKPAEHEYVLGAIHYRLGAEAAVFKNDHKSAIAWYAKAIPLLEKPLAAGSADLCADQGEAFISMGVSYWQTGDKKKAVELTGEGVHLVEQAVTDNLAERAQLEIPYANLANMHRELGDQSSSQKFAEMATRIKDAPRRK